MKLAYADRDSYYADPAFVKVPAEGLLSKAYAKERAALIDPQHASSSFIAGDPFKYDSKVKDWPYWRANVGAGPAKAAAAAVPEPMTLASLGRDSAGISKDTTHMAIIDKDGIRTCTPRSSGRVCKPRISTGRSGRTRRASTSSPSRTTFPKPSSTSCAHADTM